MIKPPPCKKCSGLTKKGVRCKCNSSCRIGCKHFCFRHGYNYIKLPGALKGTCTDYGFSSGSSDSYNSDQHHPNNRPESRSRTVSPPDNEFVSRSPSRSPPRRSRSRSPPPRRSRSRSPPPRRSRSRSPPRRSRSRSPPPRRSRSPSPPKELLPKMGARKAFTAPIPVRKSSPRLSQPGAAKKKSSSSSPKQGAAKKKSSSSPKQGAAKKKSSSSSSSSSRGTKSKKKFCGYNSSVIDNGVEIKRSNIPNAGLGLFASKKFSKGDTVTEYDGVIIDRNTAMQLREDRKDTHIVALTVQHSAIDGLKKQISGRGGASFANDINDTKDYNVTFCRTSKIIPGLPDTRTGTFTDLTRVFLKATKDINPGEEIYVNYGKGTRDRLLNLTHGKRTV